MYLSNVLLPPLIISIIHTLNYWLTRKKYTCSETPPTCILYSANLTGKILSIRELSDRKFLVFNRIGHNFYTVRVNRSRFSATFEPYDLNRSFISIKLKRFNWKESQSRHNCYILYSFFKSLCLRPMDRITRYVLW